MFSYPKRGDPGDTVVKRYSLGFVFGRTAVRFPLVEIIFFEFPLSSREGFTRSRAHSQNGWMDVCECTRAQPKRRDLLSRSDRGDFLIAISRRSFSSYPSVMEDCPALKTDGK